MLIKLNDEEYKIDKILEKAGSPSDKRGYFIQRFPIYDAFIEFSDKESYALSNINIYLKPLGEKARCEMHLINLSMDNFVEIEEAVLSLDDYGELQAKEKELIEAIFTRIHFLKVQRNDIVQVVRSDNDEKLIGACVLITDTGQEYHNGLLWCEEGYTRKISLSPNTFRYLRHSRVKIKQSNPA